MNDKFPIQDQIFDYSFIHEWVECTIRFSNPILEDEVTFDFWYWRFWTLKCSEIIERSFKRKNVITWLEEIW